MPGYAIENVRLGKRIVHALPYRGSSLRSLGGHANVCALDVGQAINPDGAINQLEGGILRAMSWTLEEALHFEGDRATTVSWRLAGATIRCCASTKSRGSGCG